MKKKYVLGIFIMIILAGGILYAFMNKDNVPKSKDGFTLRTIDNSYEKVSKIYTQKYQDSIHKQILDLKQSYRYDIDNPLLVANPYQTVTNGLYVYFSTKTMLEVQYTVSCDGYNDYTNLVYNNDKDNLTTEHEFLIIGLIPEKTNTITLQLLDASGNIADTVQFSYTCPKMIGQYSVPQLDIEKGESTAPLSNGLYTILGNDVSKDANGNEIDASFIAMYDNLGVLRCEIPSISYRSHRMIFDENGMYFSASGSKIVRMDSTGYINRIYDLDPYLLHHDYIFGSNNDLLVLGTDESMGTQQDLILDINLDTAEVSVLIDLKDIFPNYYSMTKKPENANYLDWMHINSFSMIDSDSFILSSRETSTIIKLSHIYSTPTIDYLIGSDNFWNGTGYESYVYTPVGDFSLQSGQHTITYAADASLPEGQYYIYLYNNNNTISTSRADYDWRADSNYSDTGIANKEPVENSFYYKYLVDENARTFSLVKAFPIPYSPYVSSVQEIENNTVTDSGRIRDIREYDSSNVLIQRFEMPGEKWVYRTYKYDYKGFWFK